MTFPEKHKSRDHSEVPSWERSWKLPGDMHRAELWSRIDTAPFALWMPVRTWDPRMDTLKTDRCALVGLREATVSGMSGQAGGRVKTAGRRVQRQTLPFFSGSCVGILAGTFSDSCELQ